MPKKVRKTASAYQIKKRLCFKNLAFFAAIFLIIISVIGAAFSLSIDTPWAKNSSKTSAFPQNIIATNSAFNMFLLGTESSRLTSSFEIPTPTQTPIPTPTPNLHFRHSKWFFSFDQPRKATVYETDPVSPKLVENSMGGVYIEIKNKLYAEIAIVQPQGQNLGQYFYNRMANIFDSEILGEKTATFSGVLKGYEARLKNNQTQQESILLFLPFRGSQFFEIVGTFPKRKHAAEQETFFKMIETLRAY